MRVTQHRDQIDAFIQPVHIRAKNLRDQWSGEFPHSIRQDRLTLRRELEVFFIIHGDAQRAQGDPTGINVEAGHLVQAPDFYHIVGQTFSVRFFKKIRQVLHIQLTADPRLVPEQFNGCFQPAVFDQAGAAQSRCFYRNHT